MIQPIRLYGDDCLKEVAIDVELGDGIKTLVVDLFDTIKQTQRGVGLAATQIGVPLRVFIIKYGTLSSEFINPVILKRSDKEEAEIEGCLSIPDVDVVVMRSVSIVIEYYVLDTNNYLIKKKETFTGISARIIQHELDHINGICITDKLMGIAKKLLSKKLNIIIKGKKRYEYKTLHRKYKNYSKLSLEMEEKYLSI